VNVWSVGGGVTETEIPKSPKIASIFRFSGPIGCTASQPPDSPLPVDIDRAAGAQDSRPVASDYR